MKFLGGNIHHCSNGKMAKNQPALKTDYTLAVRYKKRDGEWSEWREHGSGIFQTIELAQRQMRLIASPYTNREKQIKFEKNGVLCDFSGKPTGKLIDLK